MTTTDRTTDAADTCVATRLSTRPTREITGLTLVAAGILALIGNLLHPRFSGNDVDTYRHIAVSTRYAVADGILLLAFLLLTAGLAALLADLPNGDPLATFARIATTVGGTIAIAQTGIELYGLRQQARTFSSATGTNQVYVFWSTNSIDGINSALYATWTVVLLGIAPLLITAALIAALPPPRWLAALGATGGALCTGVGIFQLLNQNQSDADIPFLIGSLLITVWIIATGLIHSRIARQPLITPATRPAI